VLAKLALVLFISLAAYYLGIELEVWPPSSDPLDLPSTALIHVQWFGSVALALFTIMWLDKKKSVPHDSAGAVEVPQPST